MAWAFGLECNMSWKSFRFPIATNAMQKTNTYPGVPRLGSLSRSPQAPGPQPPSPLGPQPPGRCPLPSSSSLAPGIGFRSSCCSPAAGLGSPLTSDAVPVCVYNSSPSKMSGLLPLSECSHPFPQTTDGRVFNLRHFSRSHLFAGIQVCFTARARCRDVKTQRPFIQ